MSSTEVVRGRQLVDWRAAIWAGIIAGALFFLLNLFMIPVTMEEGTPWMVVRLFASILLGQGILPPPTDFHAGALIAALAVHFTLSILFAMLIAFVIHRGGVITGTIGGALIGLALYYINFHSLTLVFEWFYAWKGGAVMASHIIFGAVAGAVYEILEVERYEIADDE